MSTSQAIAFGALAASLVWAVVFLSVLVRFVASDIEGFRKWLDRGEAAL